MLQNLADVIGCGTFLQGLNLISSCHGGSRYLINVHATPAYSSKGRIHENRKHDECKESMHSLILWMFIIEYFSFLENLS